MRRSRHWLQTTVIVLLLCGLAAAQITERVDLTSAGTQVNGGSVDSSISADGRYVAFLSDASNLPHGTAAKAVFVRDRYSGLTEIASVSSNGTPANNDLDSPVISRDGRFVVFISTATNLVPGTTGVYFQIFLHDRQTGTTECESVNASGVPGNATSLEPAISGDGRYVAFGTNASNLLPNGANSQDQIIVRDRVTGLMEVASVDSNGIPEGGGYPFISTDGRYVVYRSFLPGGSGIWFDVFIHDRQTGLTELVSVDSTGAGGGNNDSDFPTVTPDGRYVTFQSRATNLGGPVDTNNSPDIFVRDLQNGTTEMVSVDPSGAPGNNFSYGPPAISDDGRYVAFASDASSLVPGDTNGKTDTFLRNRLMGITTRVSLAWNGAQGNDLSGGAQFAANARYVLFDSRATNLVPGDTNGGPDSFVRDLLNPASPTSLCDPGVAGVIPCPCSNPPSGPGSGCDNSFMTGGAMLSAAGMTYLAMDQLVLSTSGELPKAVSVFMQADTLVGNGVVFGQGVRCAGGTLKRLYTKSAFFGSVGAPEPGDPSVSARSAMLGDVIHGGQDRWYFVYYRDPVIPGGCSAASGFNSTQALQVTWSY